MAESSPKKRSPNFTASDCLLLAEIMGEDGKEGLSRHVYLKQRFSSTITSSSKKAMWSDIEQQFKIRSQIRRDANNIRKKWDNLVQVHRSLYSDHMHNLHKTGGGPTPVRLSILTEAIMDVIGRNAVNTTGVLGMEMDSTSILLDTLHNNSLPSSNEYLPSTSAITQTSMSSTATQRTADEMPPNQLLDVERDPTVQLVCCKCNCHRKMEVLKEEKLRLQILWFKKQLNLSDSEE